MEEGAGGDQLRRCLLVTTRLVGAVKKEAEAKHAQCALGFVSWRWAVLALHGQQRELLSPFGFLSCHVLPTHICYLCLDKLSQQVSNG